MRSDQIKRGIERAPHRALLKATGEGIGKSLNEVEVSFLPGEPARLLSIAGDYERAAVWSLQDLPAPGGFVAALAIQDRNTRVTCMAGRMA